MAAAAIPLRRKEAVGRVPSDPKQRRVTEDRQKEKVARVEDRVGKREELRTRASPGRPRLAPVEAQKLLVHQVQHEKARRNEATLCERNAHRPGDGCVAVAPAAPSPGVSPERPF